MWRLRRTRIILALAVFVLFLLFHFKSIPDQWTASNGRFQTQHSSPQKEGTQQPARPKVDPGAKVGPARPEGPQRETTTTVAYQEYTTATDAVPGTDQTVHQAPQNEGLAFDTRPPPLKPTLQTAHNEPEPEGPTNTRPAQQAAAPAQTVAGTAAGGPEGGEFGLKTSTTTSSEIHWTKLPEHFPVPPEKIIPLPTGQTKSIPRIQHNFKDETTLERTDREVKQKRIKDAFKKSWSGYTEYAWLHDELTPTSGWFKDPFCGWAATLVDSLDTLYIMGLENEFKEAVQAVGSIDFTTTTKQEIPVFETTIRYLGGMLSAYDLSKEEILLTKAVELAEVLMGAFDTPNRMPQTFYQWKPVFVEQPKRARTRAVMAELGSLSMEFTRLAQVTKENKYYDAIARITDEFDVWQNNTIMPGLWPLYVDASGCKKPNVVHQDDWQQKLMNGPKHGYHDKAFTSVAANAQKPAPTKPAAAGPQKPEAGKVGRIANWDDAPEQSGEKAANAPGPVPVANTKPEAGKAGKIANWDEKKENLPEGKVPTRQMEGKVLKRQLDSAPDGTPGHPPSEDVAAYDGYGEFDAGPLGSDLSVRATQSETTVQCIPQGLASPPGSTSEEFSFGGQADSTYEYLPKQYLLLGGQVPQYQKMYEKAIDTANKHLLFRAMNPENVDILALGIGEAEDKFEEPGNFHLKPIISHLLCFTGGMYGMASKIFDRPEDLEIAKKMTDACVWAYGITKTGIMAEDMYVMPCDNIETCPWNQTTWEYEIDPFPEIRIEDGLELMRSSKAALENNEALAADSTLPGPGSPAKSETTTLAKRQLGGVEHDEKPERKPGPGQATGGGRGNDRMDYLTYKNAQDSAASRYGGGASLATDEPLSQKEYVEYQMNIRELPKGVTKMISKKYILRPEAIESVFYMYRLTGDPIWREKGWRMFEAVEKATDAPFGASAISDVMDDPDSTVKLDSMESFWLAETLKYFYLLFSTEDLISLDEWVLNTEAHPFKRPQ